MKFASLIVLVLILTGCGMRSIGVGTPEYKAMTSMKPSENEALFYWALDPMGACTINNAEITSLGINSLITELDRGMYTLNISANDVQVAKVGGLQYTIFKAPATSELSLTLSHDSFAGSARPLQGLRFMPIPKATYYIITCNPHGVTDESGFTSKETFYNILLKGNYTLTK
ncbi:hypothetical protein [Sulfurimonas sp. HSL-1716]|uniref:hypothetical protein n=1 Tax=Hydrocurvibacter sulfurireducens TaxID=3131937 RepID=UPI0031F90B2C